MSVHVSVFNDKQQEELMYIVKVGVWKKILCKQTG